MTYLKAAVDQQRSLLIEKLIKAGVVDPSDTSVYSSHSIAELLREYERNVVNKKDQAI